MNKILLIIKREYLTRVLKKSFILTTLLTPIGILALMGLVAYLANYSEKKDEQILVLDQSELLSKDIKTKTYTFVMDSGTEADLRTKALEGEYVGLLIVPSLDSILQDKFTPTYYSRGVMTPDLQVSLERTIRNELRAYKIAKLELDDRMLEALDTQVDLVSNRLDPEDADGKGGSSMTAIIGGALGGGMAFFMYLIVFIYGSMVMRSVMEEKTNRIAEVIISSVKPIQLMWGKIIGLGLVGLTQTVIWGILVGVFSLFLPLIFGDMMSSSDQLSEAMSDPGVQQAAGGKIAQIMTELARINWVSLFFLFIFYFLGGYLIYASMFAAIGSAVGDDYGESQTMTLPISIPVIMALYITFAVIRDPNSNLAVWSSIFPLFSPIVMPARLAFDPPWWQVVTSLVVLAASCYLFVWLAGRIYRVGILMYGKQASFKELAKWMWRG